MTPVTQTKVSIKNSKDQTVVNGNCLAACIASMLDLPITEVPNVEVFYHLPREDNFYLEVLWKFLKSKGYNLECDDRFKCFHPELGEKTNPEWQEELKDRYYFISGVSPRGLYHITIWKNGVMVHDPHPTKEGLLTLETFQVLELINEKPIN